MPYVFLLATTLWWNLYCKILLRYTHMDYGHEWIIQDYITWTFFIKGSLYPFITILHQNSFPTMGARRIGVVRHVWLFLFVYKKVFSENSSRLFFMAEMPDAAEDHNVSFLDLFRVNFCLSVHTVYMVSFGGQSLFVIRRALSG